MKVENFKCLKCGCDEFTVIDTDYTWNYLNAEIANQSNTKIVCPKCGSELILMYPEWRNYRESTLIMCKGEKNRTHIFNIANIEGYKGHIVKMVDDKGTYVFFEKLSDENKESDKNVKYWSTLCAEKDTQISDLKDKIKELENKKQNDIAVAKAEMQDKIDSLNVNLDYHVKQKNYFREQYHKYKELSEKIHNNNIELLNKMDDLYQQCNELEKGVQSWKAEADRAHIWLREDRKEKESLEAEIAYLNRRLCKTEDFVDEISAAKIKELEEELEKYKKQCNRLSNEKINAWSSTHDNLNNANEQIKKLEAECAKWKNNFYKVCEEYTVYQKETRDNQNYYKLWKDLADKYCKLEDQYKVAVALGDKLLKQVTDLEKEKELRNYDLGEEEDLRDCLGACNPSGTGCCLDEE